MAAACPLRTAMPKAVVPTCERSARLWISRASVSPASSVELPHFIRLLRRAPQIAQGKRQSLGFTGLRKGPGRAGWYAGAVCLSASRAPVRGMRWIRGG